MEKLIARKIEGTNFWSIAGLPTETVFAITPDNSNQEVELPVHPDLFWMRLPRWTPIRRPYQQLPGVLYNIYGLGVLVHKLAHIDAGRITFGGLQLAFDERFLSFVGKDPYLLGVPVKASKSGKPMIPANIYVVGAFTTQATLESNSSHQIFMPVVAENIDGLSIIHGGGWPVLATSADE